MGFDAKSFIQQLPQKPGVYKMFDDQGECLYIGKASNLMSRVGSYFRSRGLDNKTLALVGRIASIEVTLTLSEAEALLLEQALIKEYRPPFNVLLRDDKSYPYIQILTQLKFPAIKSFRGHPKKKVSKTKMLTKPQGEFYGPYPNAQAVNDSILWLQKTFQLRNCEESFFNSRTRPCLQYQIKRCSAPCIGLISEQDYQSSIQKASLFLKGKSQYLLDKLQQEMVLASEALDYERAALLRDQIMRLRKIQEKQHIYQQTGDAEVIAINRYQGYLGVYVLTVQNGQVLGGHGFFPKHQDSSLEESLEAHLTAYIVQNYLNEEVESELLSFVLSHNLLEPTVLCESWLKKFDRPLKYTSRPKGARKGWLNLAKLNLEQALKQKLNTNAHQRSSMLALQQVLHLPTLPRRIECFDVSHTFGQQPVASCTVFIDGVSANKEYRRFNIEAKGGDDYAGIEEAVRRRYQRSKSESISLPDLVLIDGGVGQVNSATEGLKQAACHELIPKVVGVAKGPERRAGWETLIVMSVASEIVLDSSSSVLHLIQRIRDEAHRFAITGHRIRRSKGLIKSSLDEIPGVGAKRKQALMLYFGSVKELKSAPISEIAKVKGINHQLASTIYKHYHPDSC